MSYGYMSNPFIHWFLYYDYMINPFIHWLLFNILYIQSFLTMIATLWWHDFISLFLPGRYIISYFIYWFLIYKTIPCLHWFHTLVSQFWSLFYCSLISHFIPGFLLPACPYGDYVDHISVGSGNLLTCDFIKTSGNCDPCQSSRLGRQNCCQTCEEVCGSVTNEKSHTNRLSDLIRELKSLIDK